MDINKLIEDAYKAQKPFAKWTEKDGEYRVDFGSMQEYPLGDRSSAIPVRRYAPGIVLMSDANGELVLFLLCKIALPNPHKCLFWFCGAKYIN